MRLTPFVHAVRSSLWVLPLLCVLAGVLVALGTLWLDRRSGYRAGTASLPRLVEQPVRSRLEAAG